MTTVYRYCGASIHYVYQPASRGGEIQLTDAMDELARLDEPGGGIVAVPIPGKRYDLGNPIDFLAAEGELARKQLSGEELKRVVIFAEHSFTCASATQLRISAVRIALRCVISDFCIILKRWKALSRK